MSSSLLSRGQSSDAVLDLPEEAWRGSERLLALYGWLIGPLLAGYLLFDRAFAYIHIPGTPLYVGELVLVVGALGCLNTGYLRVLVRDDPLLALLGAFFLWGFIRFLPGLRAYGIFAVRDFALIYYCLFAYFVAVALERSPDLLGRLIVQLNRFLPWLLLWLPVAVILGRIVAHGPTVPFSGSIPVTAHKVGDAAIAALLAVASLWLFPEGRSDRNRGLWSVMALVVIGLVATQNRGGLLAAVAGMAVGLAFFRDRARLIVRAIAATVLLVVVGSLLSVQIVGSSASQGRAFSVTQLFSNVASITGAHESGNLNGTVQGRTTLWTQVLQKQTSDDKLVYGYGFGINLAYLAGGTVGEGSRSDPLRSPHNSHLDVLARLGVIGLSLWIALWIGWYLRMIRGCRRLAERGLLTRRRVAVMCLMVTTATLVGSFFDPSLEGAQAAVLMWIAVGVGVAVTSFRAWFGDQDLHLEEPTRRSRRYRVGAPRASTAQSVRLP